MGQPKASLPFGPETMLARVARLLGEAAEPIVVVAAADQDVPALPGSIRVVRDDVADRGPLQGLAVGLNALPTGIELVYVTATDAPFLNPAWVARLVERIGDHDLAISEIGGFLHPLAALYRVEPARAAIARLLADDRLRPSLLADALRTIRLDAQAMASVDPGLETLRNLNTPEDYREALRLAGFDPGPG
jgi:molybdopterin-guanine dinucleotide biosynthesis protein A